MATSQEVLTALEAGLVKEKNRTEAEIAQGLLGTLVQPSQYVGEVYSLSYETALVQIHDEHRMRVGGIPSLCFLVATRLRPSAEFDWRQEDSALILLRVMDAAPLPNAQEADRLRVEAAQRVADPSKPHWDEKESMDAMTAMIFGFAGVRCRVIGTFYLQQNPTSKTSPLKLAFGSDISNYYPNRGLKVYKPNEEALGRIVNFRETVETQFAPVPVGVVRYASTARPYQGIGTVPVQIDPRDLLTRKTALFGMTRTGKSNTTKVILKAVFDLRFAKPTPLRVGQIVFDPNGEYANQNVQDLDGNQNPSALKNVWMRHGEKAASDVITYGIVKNANDLNRRLMLLNFFDDRNLQLGKEIIDAALEADSSKYIRNFCQVIFAEPADEKGGARTRYDRRVMAYRALLAQAGFEPPKTIAPKLKGLFGKELLEAMHTGGGHDNEHPYVVAAETLAKDTATWQQIAAALKGLHEFMDDPKGGFRSFNDKYMKSSSEGEGWADEDLKKILEMIHRPNGPRQLGALVEQHTPTTTTDFVDDIYAALADGKLVIVDQSSGNPELNRASSYRIVTKIFTANLHAFTSGKDAPHILVFVEEAHNILPAGTDMDTKNYWVRAAKEGAKCNIGLVYATQEVSSIQRNILKNTTNWFIGHLNNTDETKELIKYEDYHDFEASIRRAPDPGFIRMKTLSNRFVVPIQVYQFSA